MIDETNSEKMPNNDFTFFGAGREQQSATESKRELLLSIYNIPSLEDSLVVVAREGVIADARRAKGVHAQALLRQALAGGLDVVRCQRRQRPAQAVPCTRKGPV